VLSKPVERDHMNFFRAFLCIGLLANSAVAQETFCSVRHLMALLPDKEIWRATANVQIPDHLSEGLVIRKPSQKDELTLKMFKKEEWMNYPFIVATAKQEFVFLGCEYGFNSYGYMTCRGDLSELTYNFNSNRFKIVETGSFLSKHKFDGNYFAETVTFGDCFQK
jgi:hypothetical protein